MLDIFLIQLESVTSKDPDCKKKNFEKVRSLLEGIDCSAVKNGILLLPEMFSTGYLPTEPSGFSADFSADFTNAEEESHIKNETVGFLQQLARDTRCIVVGSGIHEIEGGKKFTNHSGIFTPDGFREVSGYHKCHPFFPELKCNFTAGKNISLVKLGHWKIASFICYDLRFPERFRDAVKQGANLITLQAAWPLVRKEHWETLLKARAIENQVYIAAVNGVSPSEKDSSKKLAGTSMIIDPQGNIIQRASQDEQALIRETVSLDPLIKYRRDFPVLQGIVDPEFIAPRAST